MNKMNSKLAIGLSMILIILGSISLFSTPPDQGKKGLTEFLNFLNSQKDELKYKNVGVLEHEDQVEVRVHCDEETLGKIMASSSDFSYSKITVVRAEEGAVTVVVIFSKTGAVPQEPAAVSEPEAKPTQPQAQGKMPPEQAGEAHKPIKCPKTVKVQAQDITPQTFVEYKYFRKPIVASKEFQVVSSMEEKIKEVLVNTGDMVAKDQVLIRYDADKIKKNIAAADTDLKNWKKELFRRENWKTKSPAAENQAKRHIASAEAIIKENTELLNQLEIKAPADGKITFIAAADTAVPKGEALLKMINAAVMKIDLPTSDLDLFEDAQRIILSFKDSGLAYVGRVEKKEDSLTIFIENETFKLNEGMEASFRVLLQKHENAIALPPNMLLENETGKFVYVVNGKFAKKVHLTLGPVEEDKVLIRSGLTLQDKLITTGIECLEDGKKIKIIGPKPEGKPEVKPVKEEVKPVKEVKPAAVGEEASEKGLLKLSLGLAYHTVSDDVFKDVYGSSLMGGYFEVGFSFTSNIEVFLAAALLSKKGTFTDFPDEVTLTMFPAYLGGKFKLNMPSKIKPYIGAAVAIYNIKEKTAAEETPYQKGTGFSLLGGASMNFSSKLALFLDLKYDIVKIAIENAPEDLSLSGLKLTLGLRFKFRLFK